MLQEETAGAGVQWAKRTLAQMCEGSSTSLDAQFYRVQGFAFRSLDRWPGTVLPIFENAKHL